jgi:hypothetical protein
LQFAESVILIYRHLIIGGEGMKKILLWVPRILNILFILFLSLFTLDVFTGGISFWVALGTFLVNMIPSFIMIILLILSWKSALLGGVLFILTGVLFTLRYGTWESWGLFTIISFPPFLIGVLFIIQWFFVGRNENAESEINEPL